MKHLFVEMTGQEDNIGDSLLRRGMVDAVRTDGIQMHVQIGRSPDAYVTGLGLQADDEVYRDRGAWLRSLAKNRGHGATSYLANAGEVITVRGPRYLGIPALAALAGVRRRHGALLHTGVGVRQIGRHPRLAKMNPLRFFDIVTWRDQASRDYTGIGDVQPDWGFATGGQEIRGAADRSLIAVSVRGDREEPSDEWVSAVRRLATGLGHGIAVFSQVQRDSEMATQLARRFDASELVLWDGPEHDSQEARVRDLFRHSAGVVSDRVHGLIVAATEGAYPFGLPPRPNEKSRRTLAPVGFPRHLGAVADVDAAVDTLADADLAEETTRAMSSARAVLEARAHQMISGILQR